MIVKIAFEKQIHLYRGQMELTKLKKHCQNVFKGLPKKFQFYYLDQENDQISINVQQDLDIAFELGQHVAIKKIFISQCDSQFQLLQINSNPEQAELTNENFCKFSDYSKQIKTVNIVKQQMSKKEEDITKQIVQKYLIESQNNLIAKIIREEEDKIVHQQVVNFMQQIQQNLITEIVKEDEEKKIVHEQVANAISQMSNYLITKMVQEEDKIAREQVVANMMQQLIENSSTKIAQQHEKQIELKASQYKVQSRKAKQIENKQQIDRIVELKINEIIPQLIKRIAKGVQAKLQINGCLYCNKNIKSSLRKCRQC